MGSEILRSRTAGLFSLLLSQSARLLSRCRQLSRGMVACRSQRGDGPGALSLVVAIAVVVPWRGQAGEVSDHLGIVGRVEALHGIGRAITGRVQVSEAGDNVAHVVDGDNAVIELVTDQGVAARGAHRARRQGRRVAASLRV